MSRSAWLTIVSYHYVRPRRLLGPLGARALSLESFQGQLDYISRYYHVVTAEQVLSALCNGDTLPERPLWLTFDDGYRDHYRYVLPELLARRWQGSFFPVGCTVDGGALLDINKIHFILALAPSIDHLIVEIRESLEEARRTCDRDELEAWETYCERLATPYRFDRPEVTLVKRLLQWALPAAVRARILDRLLRKFVTADEAALAGELYLCRSELMTMKESGMLIGAHTWSHPRLTRLAEHDRETEIERSRTFLEELGIGTDRWIMAYPHGDTNEAVVRSARNKGCCLGLTDRRELVRIPCDDLFQLSRLDTNDLPGDPDAVVCLRTATAMSAA